jgi:hypothetical protein
MGRHGLARPNPANFLFCAVANRKNEIELRCTGPAELLPGLGPKVRRYVIELVKG